MIRKEVPDRARRRVVPEGFGWVDHRLAREGYFGLCRPEAMSLYLFLATVADADGVSWYSDRRLCKELNLTPGVLDAGRRELLGLELVVHQPPFHQVLELPRRGPGGGVRERAARSAPPAPPRAAEPEKPAEAEDRDGEEVFFAVPGYPPWFRSSYRREDEGEAVAIGDVIGKIIEGVGK